MPSSSRRLPTDSVDNLEIGQTDSIAFDYINFDRFFTNDDKMTSLLKKLSISIKIGVIKRYGMESVWPVSKLSTESVGSRRRELVANSCSHRRRRHDKTVSSASAVCIGHKNSSSLSAAV